MDEYDHHAVGTDEFDVLNNYYDDDDDDDDEYDNFYGAITQHMPLQGRLDKKPIACKRYDFSK